MIGIVVVSHSSKVAEGICDMVQQISSRDGEKLPIYPAGGNAQGGLGTDPQRVLEAIKKADQGVAAVSNALDTLETGTKDLPKAAAGVKTLNEGFQKLTANDPMLIEAWKALPKLELTKGFIPIIDASYSMNVHIPGSKYKAMHVALGLGSYLAYNNPSPVFNHWVLTFSKHPKLVELPMTGDNPYDIAKIYHANSDFMGLNTDIYRAFMLILNAAVKANIPDDQIPDILILSDMEFDCNERYRKTFVDEEDDDKTILMDDIANKYKDKGYSLPRCIWWNLNSRSMAIPQIKNENGIIMLSGFSQNALKMIESNELDPYKVLLETIHSERYQPILEIMK